MISARIVNDTLILIRGFGGVWLITRKTIKKDSWVEPFADSIAVLDGYLTREQATTVAYTLNLFKASA